MVYCEAFENRSFCLSQFSKFHLTNEHSKKEKSLHYLRPLIAWTCYYFGHLPSSVLNHPVLAES